MNDQIEFIESALRAAATKHYEENRSGFETLELFQEYVATCYYIIARRFVLDWKDKVGDGASPERMGEAASFMLVRANFRGAHIPRSEFANALGHHNTPDGAKPRRSYTACLDALVAEKIVHVCGFFSPKRKITKSYSLHNEFLRVLLARYQSSVRTGAFSISSAVCCRCPKPLLKSKMRMARRLYKALSPIDGVRLALPRAWDEEGCDEMGRMVFNPDLSIDNLISGMKLFKGPRKDVRIIDGRQYDWFTDTPKAFRAYLLADGSQFREIVDLPSGLFLTLAIDGCRKGRIPHSEARALLDLCFSKAFYSEIAGEPKCDFIKKVFMGVMNDGGSSFKMRYNKDVTFRKIADALSQSYPSFWAYVQTMRNSTTEKWGKYLHSVFTVVEKELIEKVMDALTKAGHQHLHRVHDAIWGTESAPEATVFLRKFAYEALDHTS